MQRKQRLDVNNVVDLSLFKKKASPSPQSRTKRNRKVINAASEETQSLGKRLSKPKSALTKKKKKKQQQQQPHRRQQWAPPEKKKQKQIAPTLLPAPPVPALPVVALEPKSPCPALSLLLDQFRSSMGEVETMLASPQSWPGTRPQVSPPDVSFAEAARGAELLAGEGQLVRMLSRDADAEVVESFGVLLRWWRLVERFYVFRGILEHLRSRKGRTPIQKRFEAALMRVRGIESISYQRATLLDRLAHFLLQCPRFVFQIHLTTVAAWFENRAELSGNTVMDAVAEFLNGRLDDFLGFTIEKSGNEHDEDDFPMPEMDSSIGSE